MSKPLEGDATVTGIICWTGGVCWTNWQHNYESAGWAITHFVVVSLIMILLLVGFRWAKSRISVRWEW